MPGTNLSDLGIPEKIFPAIRLLYEAALYATQTSGNTWEFAVEIDELTGAGLSNNDLRWLVRKNYVEHQREVTIEGDDGRAFRPAGDMTFECDTCFVLTSCGISLALELCRDETDRIAGFSSVRSGTVSLTNSRDSHDHESLSPAAPSRNEVQSQYDVDK